METIKEMNPVTGEIVGIRNHVAIYPASHYVTSKEKIEQAIEDHQMKSWKNGVQWFQDRGKLIEAQRIEQRTRYDMEMLQGSRDLQRHRELFPSYYRTAAGLQAVYPDRLYSGRFSDNNR